MRLFSLTLLLVLAASLPAKGYQSSSSPDIKLRGDVSYAVQFDVVTYQYRIVVYGFVPDSVAITLDSTTLLFARSGDSTLTAKEVEWRIESSDLHLAGSLTRSLIGRHAVAKSCQIVAWKGKRYDNQWASGWLYLRPNTVRILYNFFGLGYGEGDLTPSDRKTSMTYSFELGGGYYFKSSDISYVLRNSSNMSNKHAFYFFEPLQLTYRNRQRGVLGINPHLWSGVVHSIFEMRRDDVKYKQAQWGLVAGVALATKFERLAYSYSTTLGGIHTFSFFSAMISGGTVRMGTRYDYVRLDRAAIFRVMLHLEGGGWGDGETETLMHVDERQWYRKALAYGAYLPFYPYFALRKLAGKDH